jgi:hypothetical protein
MLNIADGSPETTTNVSCVLFEAYYRPSKFRRTTAAQPGIWLEDKGQSHGFHHHFLTKSGNALSWFGYAIYPANIYAAGVWYRLFSSRYYCYFVASGGW